MHAVYPRARVRLSALAIAFSLPATLVLSFSTAHAEPPSSALTSNVAVNAPAPPALSLATVQISQHDLAHDKAVARKAAHWAALHKAALHRAAVHKAAAHRAAVHRAAVHKAKLAKAAARAAFGRRVIRAAAKYRGTPYRYGAAGPSRFDCSGFTRFVFAKFGISLPHSSSGQYSVVQHISSSQKRIGDLVFFHSSGGHVYHVGIYAGGNEIWAATHTGDFVRLEGMWNASYYVGRIS